MPFTKAASTKDLQPARMIGVEVNGKEILLTNLDGRYFAIGNRCTHLSCLLSDGNFKEGNVTCPCHTSIFNAKTGDVIRGPARKPEPVFETKIEGEEIFVNVP